MTELSSFKDLQWYVGGMEGARLKQVPGSYEYECWVFFLERSETLRERVVEKLEGEWEIENRSPGEASVEVPNGVELAVKLTPPSE